MREAIPDADAIIGEHWPYDGPHTPEHVREAAGGLYELVRYLNNATSVPGRGLPYASSSYWVISSVLAAVAGLDQLLRQLADAINQQAVNPTLYDDRRDRPGAHTATDILKQLGNARRTALLLADQLSAAARSAGHLGYEDPEGVAPWTR